jgi:hypothetical protein
MAGGASGGCPYTTEVTTESHTPTFPLCYNLAMSFERIPAIAGLSELLSAYFRGESTALPSGQTHLSLTEQVAPYGIANLVTHALSPSLTAEATSLAIRNLTMLTIAAEFSALLDVQRIPHSYVRGAALLPLYPRPDDRSFSDLDLLIPHEYAGKALSCILARGVKTYERDRISFLAGYWDGIQLFLQAPHKSLLELHTDIAPPGRFPHPKVSTPPYRSANELPMQALAVILHESTHHYQQPVKALCDILLLAAKGLDWDALSRMVTARHAWNTVLPLVLDLEHFAPGIAPRNWLARAQDSRRARWISTLADTIHARGGVYAGGSLWRRSLLTALALPDAPTAARAIWRGLVIRLKHSKITADSDDG